MDFDILVLESRAYCICQDLRRSNREQGSCGPSVDGRSCWTFIFRKGTQTNPSHVSLIELLNLKPFLT